MQEFIGVLMRIYPSREGVPIPLEEIDLPESNLDPTVENNFNIHHNLWTKKAMARSAITQTMRDLKKHQFELPKDTHNWLHRNFSPPKMPTIEQAMKEVMDTYMDFGSMQVYDQAARGYIVTDIPFETIMAIREEYTRSKGASS